MLVNIPDREKTAVGKGIGKRINFRKAKIALRIAQNQTFFLGTHPFCGWFFQESFSISNDCPQKKCLSSSGKNPVKSKKYEFSRKNIRKTAKKRAKTPGRAGFPQKPQSLLTLLLKTYIIISFLLYLHAKLTVLTKRTADKINCTQISGKKANRKAKIQFRRKNSQIS